MHVLQIGLRGNALSPPQTLTLWGKYCARAQKLFHSSVNKGTSFCTPAFVKEENLKVSAFWAPTCAMLTHGGFCGISSKDLGFRQ